MSAIVTAVLYAGVVVLVPLLVVLPILLLERRREDGGAGLTDTSSGAVFRGGADDRSNGSDHGESEASDAVACRTCGELNGADYTFCRECAEPLAGR
ncbi:DUF7577 domain-containing protein [Halostella salina]|uniref:DUF7577 domain-containing protein n=1 Tax=Halostella salina TaxID=1547897 RepID=UPI000EF7ED6E|nr:hypothetical protein [Halostella salina]